MRPHRHRAVLWLHHLGCGVSFRLWLVRLSIAINNLTGGPQGYTLCARFWDGRLGGSSTYALLVWVADHIFWREPNHCHEAWLRRFDP